MCNAQKCVWMEAISMCGAWTLNCTALPAGEAGEILRARARLKPEKLERSGQAARHVELELRLKLGEGLARDGIGCEQHRGRRRVGVQKLRHIRHVHQDVGREWMQDQHVVAGRGLHQRQQERNDHGEISLGTGSSRRTGCTLTRAGESCTSGLQMPANLRSSASFLRSASSRAFRLGLRSLPFLKASLKA